jgi:membrane protein
MRRTFAHFWLLTRRTFQKYSADNCSQLAAAISYYVLFSLVPLAIFLASVFGIIMRDDDLEAKVIDRVTDAVAFDNQDGRDFVANTVHGVSRASGALGAFAIAAAAWSGAAMFGAMRRSLNIVWRTDTRLPFAQQKLVDLSMVLGMGILLGASVGATIALRTIREVSDDLLGPLSRETGLFWEVVPFLVPGFLSFVTFLLIYRYVPNVRHRFADVWPGALLAAVLFEALKNGFAIYVAHFRAYDAIYGVLGGVLLFLTWTYLSASILLLGGEVASLYPRLVSGELQSEALASPLDPRTRYEKVRDFVRGLFVGNGRVRT